MLTLVPTPIGNIADISLRAMDALVNADVLLCEDTRVTKKLLMILKERYGKSADREQTFISVHSHSEHRFLEKTEPSFFEQLVRYCIEYGIPYDVLPGANAVLTAFAASGFPQTQMLFFGFLPHKGGERSTALQQALYNGYTTVLYEAPHRLEKLLGEIDAEAPQRRLFAAKELTKLHQGYYHGTAAEILGRIGGVKGEWAVVVEAGEARGTLLGERDILALDLPKKAAAKLIAKVTGETPKACYQRLLENGE